MSRRRLVAMTGALALSAGLAVVASTPANAGHRERAAATLRLADGRTVGTVSFFGDPWTVTEVRVTVRMPRQAPAAGFHGFHITDAGRAYSVSITDRVAVADVLQRAVVLHAGADNLGNVPVGSGATQYTPNSPEATALTARTGNAGDRLACGVIRAR
jgi:Cu/Zn superoxide dismutase